MIALRLLEGGMDKRSLSVLPACRSRLVQSVGCVKQSALNRQPPVSLAGSGLQPEPLKELNRMSGRLCRTFRLLSLFFFLIIPSVFLADTANAQWGTATVDNTSSADTGNDTSIAVGTSGAVYISYQDVTNRALCMPRQPL